MNICTNFVNKIILTGVPKSSLKDCFKSLINETWEKEILPRGYKSIEEVNVPLPKMPAFFNMDEFIDKSIVSGFLYLETLGSAYIGIRCKIDVESEASVRLEFDKFACYFFHCYISYYDFVTKKKGKKMNKIKLITLMLSLSLLNCSSTKFVSLPNLLEQKSYNEKTEFPLYLNIMGNFSDHEIDIIKLAANNWKEKTKGIFYVVFIDKRNEKNKFEQWYEYDEEFTLWKANNDEEEVALLSIKHGFFDGITKGNFILINPEFIDNDHYLYLVFKHELGHLAGLGHLKKEYSGVMTYKTKDPTITSYDLMQFCQVYKESQFLCKNL